MIDQVLHRIVRQFSNDSIWTYLPVVIALMVASLAYAIILQIREKRAPLLRIIFCFIATLCLALFCGLRHFSVGTDTERYYHMVGDEFNVTFSQILDNYLPNRAEDREIEELPREVVFHVVSDQLRLCGFSEYGVFTFYALFYVGVAGWLVYRHSDNPIVSYFAFMAVGAYVFGFTGLRQAIAIGFTMLAYPFIEKRNFLFFTFFVLVGMLFHKSAVIFFPAYFVTRFDIKLTRLAVIALVVFYIYKKAPYIAENIVKIFGDIDERVEGYFGETEELQRSATTCGIRYVIFFLYLTVCLLTRGKKNTFTPEETILMNMVLIGAIFETFSLQGWAGMPRLGLYYSAYTILLVPKLVEESKHYIPLPYSITVATFSVLASLYFMKVISIFGPYHYNWQGWVNVG